MKRLGGAAIAAALVAVTIVTAGPAFAAELADTVSARRGPAGSVVRVASTDVCPAAPTGTSLKDVIIVVIDWPNQTIVSGTSVTPNADGSWSGSVTIGADVRNGPYNIGAGCHSTSTGSDSVYAQYKLSEFDVTSPAGKSNPAVRIAGYDRITTAIAASQDVFKTSPSTPTVVLSRSDSYADALAGTPLAVIKSAPLLLTGSDTLDQRTQSEITRILRPNGTVFVLGGTSAISDNVVTSLTFSGYTVTRLAGINRFDTAVKIAGAIGTPSTLLLATGNAFPDGLVAGAAADSADAGTGGGAVLLTDGTTMAPETKAYIDANGTAKRFSIGAPAAAADPGATPIVGTDDADTSQKVAAQFFAGTAAVSVASLATFPDALSGGAHAGAFGSPLLLTNPDRLPPSVAGYFTARKADITIAFVYGGTAAISENVRAAVVQAIS